LARGNAIRRRAHLAHYPVHCVGINLLAGVVLEFRKMKIPVLQGMIKRNEPTR
jgi:hypothetical protein